MIRALIVIVVIIFFGIFVMYNNKVLERLEKTSKRSEKVFYRLFGKTIRNLNLSLERTITVNKGSRLDRISRFFKDIIINLDLSKDGVTPVGLVAFITSISLACTIFFVVATSEISLALPMFSAVFYFIVVIFRFMSIVRFERKEAMIMDTEDLLVMDIKDGVYNAILRLRKTAHPEMIPYLEEFIDNVQNKGFGFKKSMLILNDRLGPTFTDFAQKAILYEEKADKTMVDIFSSIVEINRYKRQLRYENDKKFNQLRFEFLVSISIISVFGVFSIMTDAYIANFFLNTFFGKVLIIVDLVIVAAVIAYMASIKSKFL